MMNINSLKSEALWEAVIRLVVEFTILYVIFFFLLGRNTNLDNEAIFFMGFFFIAVLIVPLELAFSIRKKILEQSSTNTSSESQGVVEGRLDTYRDPWQLLLPYSLITAVVGAAVCYFIPGLIGDASIFLKLFVLLTITTLAILPLVYLLNKQYFTPLFERVMSGGLQDYVKQEKTDNYYVINHMLPWGIIVCVLSFMVAYKNYEELLFSAGSISVSAMAFSVASTCFAISLWLWHESHTQTQQDLSLGLVQAESSDSLSSSDLFFCFPALSAAITGLILLLGFIFHIEEVPFTVAVIVHMVFTVASGVCGNILGVIWAFKNHQETTNQAIPR